MVRLVRHRAPRTTVWAIVLVAGLLGPQAAFAALRAYVDRNPVPDGESFTLTIESDSDASGTPDWSPLGRDFELRGQGRSSSVQVVNGSVTRKTRWQISLIPKHGGTLRIPSIALDGESSPPLTIEVSAATPAPRAQQGGDLFLEVSAAPRTAYVQQQIVYTVRLYRSVNLADGATLSAPALAADDAIVEKLGKDRQYQTVRNGMQYDVLERAYAVYPQRSGEIEVAPLEFDGDIVQGGNGLFGFDPFFSQSTRHKRVRSEALRLTVKPVPAAFRGRRWLPAREVELEESWSPAPAKFEVGQPVTRTLEIRADGLSASQLPALGTVAVPGVKSYPDQPLLKDDRGPQGIKSSRTEKIAFIPARAGRITFPAIQIPWWNTATDRMETASLPERSFDVVPAAEGGLSPPAVPSTLAPAGRGAPLVAQPPPARQTAIGPWPWIAFALGSGWLATLLAWGWRTRRRGARTEAARAEEESARRLEKTLKACCLANDAAGAKRAVLAWSRRRWPEQPPISLVALAKRSPAPLARALMELDRALYAGEAPDWRGEELWRRFWEREAISKGTVPGRNRTAAVEALYAGD